MDAKELAHTAAQIERCVAERSYGDVSSILDDLEKLQIPAEQLEASGVGRAVFRLLKSCSEAGARKRARSLLGRWKKQHSRDIGGGRRRRSREEAGQSLEAEEASRSCDLSPLRSKCVELLLGALHPEPQDQDRAAELAQDIERHIHLLHTSNQARYKACVRSKVSNLRNPSSQHLRSGLLSGSLAPDAFARMSTEEMASTELQQLRAEYSSRGVSERQLPQAVEGASTQKLRCRRCGGSDCKVTQVSRGTLFLPAWVRQGGPDHDAMTFVTCSGCGQQWYHSGWICL